MRWFTSLLPRFFSSKESAGGRGSRRSVKATGAGSQEYLDWYVYAGAMLLVVVAHVSTLKTDYTVVADLPVQGAIVESDIMAPFSFSAPLLESDVEMMQLQKVLVEPPVVRRLPGRAGRAQRAVENFLDALSGSLALGELPIEERIGLLEIRFPDLHPAGIRHAFETELPGDLFTKLEAILASQYDEGIVDNLPPGNYRNVWIKSTDGEVTFDVASMVEQGEITDTLVERLVADDVEPVQARWIADLIRPLVEPDLVYSPEDTRARRMAARESVPRFREFIEGERIIASGERVSELTALFLSALETELAARGARSSQGPAILRALGQAMLIAGLLFFFAWLAALHFRSILVDTRSTISIAVILAIVVLVGNYTLRQPNLGPYTMPIHWLAVLLTTLYRSRIGYATTIFAVVLLALLPDVQTWWMLGWLIEGVMAVTLIREIRNRDQFYKAIAVLSGLSLVLITGFEYLGGGLSTQIWKLYAVGVLTPIVSVAVALFLLPIVEPLVGACSDLTLLELSDLNHPLLRKLSLESQGTFHHSLVVSQLSEHAAEAISANSLLARVGGLFHDIGKLNKSEYFVENQGGGHNKHDDLSPNMSALVVASHVKEGITLARKWRLPQDVIDAIPEHHGTQVIKYFYHKALESAGNETVKVDDFRYPGPRPQSREMGILMLADASEAATRALAKPTPGRIREVTKQIADERMLNGELDACGLSLRDIAQIREAFIPLLTGIHHARITYPGQKGYGQTASEGENL